MKYVIFALQILPVLLEAILRVESIFTGSGLGPTKKALVTNYLGAALSANLNSTTDVQRFVEGQIDTTVAQLNGAGIFKAE